MYHLGLRFVEMASLVLQDVDLQRWAHPYLQHLASQTGETIDLGVMDGTHIVYLDVVESPQRVKIAAGIGQRLPVACTATGKVLLAHLPDDQVRAILQKGLRKYTDQTLLSPEELLEDLRQTRERGFAISVQEFEKDINAVAAPILDGNHLPVAAVADVGPSYRLPHERMLELGQLACQATQAMAREVGMSALSEIASRTVTPAHLPRAPRGG
jgi:DNA-binding IclR family transcriptional regulator